MQRRRVFNGLNRNLTTQLKKYNCCHLDNTLVRLDFPGLDFLLPVAFCKPGEECAGKERERLTGSKT